MKKLSTFMPTHAFCYLFLCLLFAFKVQSADEDLAMNAFPPHKCIVSATEKGAAVYDHEYGVVVSLDSESRAANQALEAQSVLGGAPITPHITLAQVRCLPHHFFQWISKVRDLASNTKSFVVDMKSDLVAHAPSGNTFWDVEDKCARDYFDPLNRDLCHADFIKLTVPLWQVTTDQDADQNLVLQYHRDFNVPGHNRPHITVAYGMSDPDKIAQLNRNTISTTTFVAKHLSVVQIDAVGNVLQYVAVFPLTVQ